MNEIEFPVLNVKMVDIDKVIANDYNPNKVAPPEMQLLKHSIEEDGYTQPIVTYYDKERDMHYLIELKASGDLDNKKARSEKDSLLQQYFMLKNLLISENKPSNNIKIFFGTAYNKYGEGNEWKQARVRQFFSKDELLIGKDYWNFVCDDSGGFDIIFSQYKLSCEKIRKALIIIKDMYF